MPRLAAGALGQESRGRPWRGATRPTRSVLRELAVNLADLAGVDPVSIYQSLLAAPGEAPLLVEKGLGAQPVWLWDGGLDDCSGGRHECGGAEAGAGRGPVRKVVHR